MNPKKLQAMKEFIADVLGHGLWAKECKETLDRLEAEGMLDNDGEGLDRKELLDALDDGTIH